MKPHRKFLLILLAVWIIVCAAIVGYSTKARAQSSDIAQQVATQLTVQNAAYASGNCIGGFNAVTLVLRNGQSGYMTNARVSSTSGQTPTITVYVFDSNPTASVCTDRSTFTLATADISKLIASPSALTLAVPTGATASFGANDYLPPRPFTAGGAISSSVRTVYIGLVSGSTFTPGSTADIMTRIGVALGP